MSIDLSFKQLETLDPSMNLQNYSIINLQGNNFKCEQVYVQNLKVQHLNLSYNNLEQLWLLPCTLITLEVNNNLIQNLTNITHLKNLRQLDISNNLLQSLHWFTLIPQITHLYLRNNKIKSAEPIRQLIYLQELDLECNEIKSTQEIIMIDQLPKINIFNIYGNPVHTDPQLAYSIKNLNVLEKNCFCRSLQHYQQSEIARKRQLSNQEEIDLFDLDEPQKDIEFNKKHSSKSMSPLSKLTKQPQFYDPSKSNKYVTFQEVIKMKQKIPDQIPNLSSTNTTINVRQSSNSLEQVKQQNKELIQEKFKLQQKLQASIKQNEIFYGEIEGYKEQVHGLLQLLNLKPQSEDSTIRALLDQLEYGILGIIKDQRKQSQDLLNSMMNRMCQKVKIMNSNIEIISMKKFCEISEKLKNVELNLSKITDIVSEQKQIINKLKKTRLSSPQMRGGCQTARHSKNTSEIDALKFKQLFFKSPNYQNNSQQERPLKTQGCSQSTSIQQFYLDNIQSKMKQLKQ